MNTIGIDNNLDRPRIRKLLLIGLIASVMTGIGDFLIGFGEEMEVSGFAESVMANALNLSDAQLIWGGLLGALGLFLEGLAFFGIYRLLNYAYKNLLRLDPAVASKAANVMIGAFCVPLWIILIIFWIPMLIVQFKAFAKGLTPYPGKAKWFNLLTGAIPALLLCLIIGPKTALGAGIGTMFLSFGNAFTFGGLLAALPSQERFDEFKRGLKT
jgi:hypothetical protein